MKGHHFFAMLSRMKYINRWGLMRNTRNETISEHSLDTAVIAHALAVLGNKRFGKSYRAERAAALALFHDAPEIITGDLPTPVKYHSPEMRQAYREVEHLATERLLRLLPADMAPEYEELLTYSGAEDGPLKQLVHAADKISAVVKCVEERKGGNLEFVQAEKALREAVGAINLPEVQCFLEEFLPSYSLTLDEQE